MLHYSKTLSELQIITKNYTASFTFFPITNGTIKEIKEGFIAGIILFPLSITLDTITTIFGSLLTLRITKKQKIVVR